MNNRVVHYIVPTTGRLGNSRDCAASAGQGRGEVVISADAGEPFIAAAEEKGELTAIDS
jgi:hypothetical protein